MKRISLLLLMITLKAEAFQPLLTGVDSSGGGNAVVCRDSANQIKTAEVLDLFEARVLFGLNIPITSENAVNQVSAKFLQVESMNTWWFALAKDAYDKVLNNARVLPDGVGLTPIDDSFSPVISKGCHIEQLAAYRIDDSLFIDGEIWAKLDETNRAALYLHEILYKWARMTGAKDSVRTRKLVGYLFAEYPFKPALDFSVTRATGYDTLCWSKDLGQQAGTSFLLHETNGQLNAYVIALNNLPVVNQKRIQMGSTNPTGPRAGSKEQSSEFEDSDQIVIEYDSVTSSATMRVWNALGIGGSDIKADLVCDRRP